MRVISGEQADMYSSNMIFPSRNAGRGHQKNQFMSPCFPRKFQLCSRKPTAKGVKTTCKIWPTVFIQPLSISLRAHQEQGKLLCRLHFCGISCFSGEERNFLSFVYVKLANIRGTGNRTRDLSPRKLKITKITPYLFWCRLAKGHSHLRTEVWFISTSVTFNINCSWVQWQDQPSSWWCFCLRGEQAPSIPLPTFHAGNSWELPSFHAGNSWEPKDRHFSSASQWLLRSGPLNHRKWLTKPESTHYRAAHGCRAPSYLQVHWKDFRHLYIEELQLSWLNH